MMRSDTGSVTERMMWMDKPFFSVIVPAHNAAGRIRKLLDSIKMQTFDDYEVIIVCDDCQDNTAEIATEYLEQELTQGIVMEVPFHNCGKTRNVGLEHVRGEWVLFSDDDDWWRENTAFAMIAETIGNYESIHEPFDILAFNFIFGYNGLARQYPGHVYIAPWSKAWRRSFIGDHRFPEVPHSDDYGFARKMHPLARFQYLDACLYYYDYERPGSITQQLHSGVLKRLEEMGIDPNGVA